MLLSDAVLGILEALLELIYETFAEGIGRG